MTICLAVFVSSCEKEEPNNEQQNPLFPLSIGNIWHYENINYYGNTTSTQLNVLGSYTIDGIKGFALTEYKKGAPISLLENDKEGNLVEHLLNNDRLVHTTVFFRKNVKKGDNWIYKSTVYTEADYSKYNIEEWLVTCVTADTIIATPIGDFHCIGFSYHPGGMQENGDPYHTMIDFLSENIGIVKSLHYEHNSGSIKLFNERILTDYSLK